MGCIFTRLRLDDDHEINVCIIRSSLFLDKSDLPHIPEISFHMYLSGTFFTMCSVLSFLYKDQFCKNYLILLNKVFNINY